MTLVKKKVKSIKVIKPASNPDVDSDFGSKNIDKVLDYVTDTYGSENVANITTFGTNASRLSFKDACTIYEVPFNVANKISGLIPNKATLNSLYDEKSDFYEDGAEFRNATSGKQWDKIVKSALKREGRIKSTGVHACGVIVSSEPLKEHIPLYTSKQGKFTTQWTYPECESLGLIKMDFLTLDTVDIIQQTLEYIMNGHDKGKIKEIPNMVKIIHQDMNDANVYKLFQNGETIGIFQFGSHLVRDLLGQMKPDRFGDLSACTAIARPGPMGMGSHTKYADRKNGREVIDYIHPDFNGSPLENILGDTYGLCVPEGTLIYDSSTSKFVEIENLQEDLSFTPSLNETTGKIENKKVSKIINTGSKRILKIKVNGNRIIRVSETHPVLTDKGYVQAKNLTIGNKLRIASIGYDHKVKNSISNNKAYLLGALLNNGIITNNQLEFINNDSDILKNVQKIIETEFENSIMHWLEDYGYTTSELSGNKKFISEEILKNSDKEALSHLIAGLWDANNTHKNIHFTTISERLLNDIGNILNILGVDYNVSEEYSNSEKDSQVLYTLYPLAEDFRRVVFPYLKSDKKNSIIFNELLVEVDNKFKNVISIEDDGWQNCYDIEVEDNHNFFINDIVVHNCVYQEQVMKIANEIAGMSLQEADVLRKAMGKKKKDVMDNMKKDFIAGSLKNGYSLEAIQKLWETIAVFSEYAFNKSHSVSYAIMSYQAAYLKTYYPREFITALIHQKASKKTKDKKGIFEYLREAKRMNITIGSVDINASGLFIEPDYDNITGYDSVFGIAGITNVTAETASIILQEREKNGKFKNVQDVIKRCVPLGVQKKSVYISLAQAGAFDCFNISRKKVVDNIVNLIDATKKDKQTNISFNLFDAFDISEPMDSFDLTGEDYTFNERLKLEADSIGLYLTEHPMSKIGNSINNIRTTSIKKMLEKRKTEEIIVASIVDIQEKGSGTHKSIIVDIEDNESYLTARLSKELIKSIEKNNARETLKKDYIEGHNNLNQQIISKAIKDVVPIKPLEVNDVYVMTIKYQLKFNNEYFASIEKINKLQLSDNGTLPLRIRIPFDNSTRQKAENIYSRLPLALQDKHPGEHEILVKRINNNIHDYCYSDGILKQMINNINEDIKNNKNRIQEYHDNEENKNKKMVNFDGEILASQKVRKKKPIKVPLRDFPPTLSPEVKKLIIEDSKNISPHILKDSIDNTMYYKTGLYCDKNQRVEQLIEGYVGYDNFDYGIQNNRLNDKYNFEN